MAAAVTWLRGFTNELARIADLLRVEVGAGIFIDPAPAGTNRPHGATFATPVRGGYGNHVGRGSIEGIRGGRPRPPTDLAVCQTVVEEIIEELKAGGDRCNADDHVKQLLDRVKDNAMRVQEAIDQSRDSVYGDALELSDDLSKLAEELTKKEKALEAERDKEEKRGWKEWLESDWHIGARRAHAATRVPTEWRPSTASTRDGGVSASPLELLDSTRNKYMRYWDASEEPLEYRWAGNCRPLERLTPQQLRAASLSFPRRTARTYDGWHVRHFALISDAGLEALATILEVVETTSRWPTQVATVTTPHDGETKGRPSPHR